MHNQGDSEDPSVPWRMLWIIVLLAFAVRLGWVLTQTDVIENEGAEYARIAQNLRNGAGYVGTMGGPQLLFPPLYPLLIALVSVISENIEAAARTVSLVAGTLLVIPVFLISLRLHGRRTAVISAVITALYPVLIALSGSTYSECIYSALIMAGLLFGVYWHESEKISDAALAGIFLGLAYLTRPEAIAYPVVLIAIVISRHIRHGNRRRTIWHSALMLACVVALATPYVAYLWRHTGQLRLEGKSEVNYAIGARLNSGLPTDEATWGLSKDAEPEGPLLDPSRYLGRKLYPKTASAAVHYFVSSVRRNFWELRHLPIFPILFWPMFVTCIFALTPLTWTRKQLCREILPVSFLAVAILPLGVAPVFSVRRLLLPVIPLALLWSAKGIDQVSSSVQIAIRRRGSKNPTFGWGAWTLAAALASLLLFFGSRSLQKFPELLSTTTDRRMKEAGLWMRDYAAGPKRIMDSGTIVSYYSEGTWLPMPSAQPTLMIKYLALQKPDFLILEVKPWNTRAVQFSKLLESQPGTQLLHFIGARDGEEVKIYRCTEQHRH